jgi:hypothetical protein
MNPFGGMIRMNRMIPAGLGGRRKTTPVESLSGCSSRSNSTPVPIAGATPVKYKNQRHLTGQAGQAQISNLGIDPDEIKKEKASVK